MQWGGWSAARMRAWAAPLAAVLVLAAASAAILAATAALAAWAATSASRDALTDGAAGLVLQVRAGDDPTTQDATARSVLADAFAPAAVTVRTTMVSEPVQTPAGRVVAWHGEYLTPGEISLVEGRWPGGPGDAAVQADAAARAGIAVGDRLPLGAAVVTVAATWRATDPEDPSWQGDRLALTGTDAQEIGPLLVSAQVIDQLPGAAYIRWGIVPDDAGADDMSALVDGSADAKEALLPADVTGRGVTVSGGLGATALAAQREVADARALNVVPWTVVVMLIVVALFQVARVLGQVRKAEVRGVIARGASVGQVALAAGVEALVVTGAGALAGAGLSAWAVGRLTGSPVSWGVPVAAAAVVAALATGLMTSTATGGAGRLIRDPRRRRIGGRVVGATGALLIPLAAVLTASRLLRDGRIDGAGGPLTLSLLGALAPAALLGAAGLAFLAMLVPGAGVLRMAVVRARGMGGWLALAHLSRGVVHLAVPVALTVVAVGFATLTSLVASGVDSVGRDLSSLERGADLRVTPVNPVASAGRVAEPPDVGVVGEVTGACPVWIDQAARLGDAPISLVSAPVAALPSAASLPTGTGLPLAALAPATPDPATRIPQGTGTLTVQLVGESTLDAWQAAELALAPELGRRGAEAPYIVGDRDAVARELTTEAFASFSAPTRLRAEVTLRNPETGVVVTVPGPEITVPGVGVDWDGETDDVAWSPGRASADRDVELPAGAVVLDGVRLTASGAGASTLTVDVGLLVDGEPVGTDAAWASDAAVPDDLAQPYRDLVAATPVDVELTARSTGDLVTYGVDSNRPRVPPVLGAGPGGTWRISADAGGFDDLTIGPAVSFDGADPLAVVVSAGDEPERVPVALTPAAAEAAALTVGDDFELFVFQRRVPATLAALTPAVPGTTAASAALADATALARALGAQGDTMPWPDEIWAATSSPEAAAVAVAQLDGVSAVVAPVERATAANLSGTSFVASAAGALVLAVAGAGAAFVAQSRDRRDETAALSRLGASPSAQAVSRWAEHSGVLLAAAVAGVGAGWGVGAIVVPPIVRTAARADSAWPVPLAADPALLAALLAGWAVLAGAVVVAVAVAVHRRAAGVADGRWGL